MISTLNRVDTLRTTLDSLRWVAYPGEFEVVVVNGPSTDGTADLLATWQDRLKVATCPDRNLSMSRNIGIAAAAGDIVAFIDDDAVPEAEWLTELAAAYSDPATGAAGGFAIDHTGLTYQSTYATFNRLGDPVDSHGLPATGMVFPYSFRFPHLIGTNTSARRSALEAVGGFDEEYEYYLDDTDVVLRIMDRGYGVVQIGGAHVHHKFAPSHIRGEARVARDRYSVIKNRTYFSSRHASDYLSYHDLRQNQDEFAAEQERQIARAVEDGLLDPGALADVRGYGTDAVHAGREAARRGALCVVDREWRTRPSQPFRPFPTVRPGGQIERTVRVASRSGNRLIARAALEDARAGLIPHVVEPTKHAQHVDFREGVWWHRVPRHDHRWGRAARAEVERLRSRFPTIREV